MDVSMKQDILFILMFDHLMAMTQGRDNDERTASQKAFNDLNTNGTLANASDKCVLVLKKLSLKWQFHEVNTSNIAAIFPGVADLVFQV